MPLAGGASEKYGNRYEGKWTAYCIAQVMAEEADSIHIEPPGPEGEGCEFALQKGPITEYHQVKRQHSRSGEWSIAELFQKGVLAHAYTKTQDPNARFVFVSTISAGLLSGLADYARSAASIFEFKEQFLKGEKTTAWSQLLREWHGQIQQEISIHDDMPAVELQAMHERMAYERLQRVHVRTTDEDSLTEMVETKLRTMVRAESQTVRHALCAMAQENIHKKLYQDGIWRHLQQLEYVRVDYSQDTSVLAAMENLNARYESMIKGIGTGITIPRDETSTVMTILKGTGRKTSALVSGEAGIGKTCVLGQAIHTLRREGIPHLYFRVDRLEPTELPRNVGTQLGLPSAPAEVLAGIAKGRTCVLIVDQLDAVSLVSGRNPEFFHCIHEIIRQTTVFTNMRLLLACRQFDIEKDNRLRELVSEHGLAQEIKVKLLAIDSVKSVLQEIGCGSTNFSGRQLELLRLPFHLAVFAEIIQKARLTSFVFTTSVDLFAAYWDMKHHAVQFRLENGKDEWVSVLDCLSDKMTERQTLFVPEHEILDEYERTVRAMESEGVLLLDGRRVGFFHEGFFDYVFARRFAAKGLDLIRYLKNGEQGLFKRAPLRQILLHAQASDHVRFVEELRRIVLDPTIRFHLRRCALEVAAKIDHASPELWQLFADAFANAEPAVAREIWRVLWTTPACFPFLHSKGLIREWLASQDQEQRQRALIMVRNHIGSFPIECYEILAPYVGASMQWNADILHIIWHRELGKHRSIFDLFLRLMERGAIKDQGHQDFWLCIYELPKTHPDWAAEALGLYLRGVLSKLDMKKIEWHFLPRDGTGERVVLEIAEKAPGAYLDAVIPIFLDIVRGTAFERNERLILDHVWYARMYREDFLSVEDSILRGLEDAFTKLAELSMPDYIKNLERLLPYGDYDSVNFVIVRALLAAPASFADQTVAYLLKNIQRLECGWPSGGGGDFRYWAARELVEHASVHCSDAALANLEQALLCHFPRWERSKDGQRWRGDWQYIMLSALPAKRRSSSVEARLAEWQRKFPDKRIKPPVESKVRCVGSPIPDKAVAKMSDAQWLKALEKYDTDTGSHRKPRRFLEGGAHQLSGILESETKRDPTRFARLSERFSDNAHRYYFHAILRGLKDSSAGKEVVFPVIRRFNQIPQKPGGQWVCGAIKKFSQEDIPDDILGLVRWLATEDDDPKTDEPLIHRAGNKEEDSPYNILTTAINTVRGVAAEAVGTLLFDKAERIPFFIPCLERMVRERTVIVRTTVAAALLGLYKHDQNKAVDLFLVLTNTDKDVLFATPHVDRFLFNANFKHFHRLEHILRRMLDSPLATVREAGARHVCLAQFNNPAAKGMVTECLAGDDAKRKGVAIVAATNLFNHACSAFCHTTLPVFFDDPSKDIRDEAASCFRNAEGRELETCKPVLSAFLKSKAFAENVEDLMWPMKRSTADLAAEILLICEAIIGVMESTGAAVEHRLYGQADKVADLVLRAYRQTTDLTFRSRCLDLIDRLLSQEAYGISEELEKFER